MTSIYLAKKMLTTKSSKCDFEELRKLRAANSQKQKEAMKSLKWLLNSKETSCRLCLKSASVKIFNKDSKNVILRNIKFVLGIEIAEGDGKPQHICDACASALEAAARLKETAEATQWRLEQEAELMSPIKEYEQTWTCKLCKITFHSEDSYHDHKEQKLCYNRAESSVCETCGIEIKSVQKMSMHRKTHIKPKSLSDLRFACTECPYRTSKRSSLNIHLRRHTGVRHLPCKVCGAMFPNHGALYIHKRRHAPPAYTCHECQKNFKTKQTLQDHIQSQHSGHKAFKCEYCGDEFYTCKAMRRHERDVHKRPRMRLGPVPVYVKLMQAQVNE